MSAMQSEVFEAFRAIDVPEDKAPRAAAALASALSSEVGASFASQAADASTTRGDVAELKVDVAGIRGEMAVLKWMMGFVLAFLVAIALRIFLH